MQITTKFNVGDQVFIFFDNRIKIAKIEEVRFTSNSTFTYIHYIFPFNDFMQDLRVSEDKVFSSKEELIASL